MKILISALLASVAGIAFIHSADAASCSTGFTSWTTAARCAAPNPNRGQSQGSGTLGLSSRALTSQLTFGQGNVNARGQGFTQTQAIITNCKIDAGPGQFNTTAPGLCNGGGFHKLTVTFN